MESQGEEVGGVPDISRVEAERKGNSELEKHLPEISIQGVNFFLLTVTLQQMQYNILEMPVATKVKVDAPSGKQSLMAAYERYFRDMMLPRLAHQKRRKRSVGSPQDRQV